IYNENSNLVSKVVNSFGPLYEDTERVLGIKLMKKPDQGGVHLAKEYVYRSEIYGVTSSENYVYDQTDDSKSRIVKTTAEYNSYSPHLPSKIITETNDPINKYTVKKIQYVGDYLFSSN